MRVILELMEMENLAGFDPSLFSIVNEKDWVFAVF